MSSPHPLPPPPDWTHLLRPGMRIHLASGAACPTALLHDLLPAAKAVGDLELVQGIQFQHAFWTDSPWQSALKVNAVYLDKELAGLVNEGTVDYTPAHYSDIPRLIRDGTIRIDASLIMVSPPDQWGYCSLGPTVEWTLAALHSAPVVIAQINPSLPRTGGLGAIHISRIHHAITKEAPLPSPEFAEPDETHHRIGHLASQLIRNGDTLQFGIGTVGNGLAAALHQHRNLGIHAEIIGDAAKDLFIKGVVDNSRKSLLPGKIVAAQAAGSPDLYAFLNQNPHVDFRPVDFTNDPITIARNRDMVSVNTALLTDLTGQIVADSVQGLFRSGVGSMVDFIRGSAMSRGGRPIIALPATGTDDQGNRFSRIVADLPPGAGVACHRADVHYLVTEYGIATLRGRSIQERTKELIQIAHPDFREDLLRRAREHHLLPAYFQLPPPVKAEPSSIPVQRITLRDNGEYLLRPLSPADDRRLQDFFYSHTEETIVRRYGFTVTRMSRERAFELVGIDQNRDLALGIFELQGPRQVIHAIGRYYLDRDAKGAEMAFVVGENKRRLGMARVLLQNMIHVARERGLQSLWAQVDRDNLPMLKLFRDHKAVESPADDPHTVRVDIPIDNPQHSSHPQKKSFLRFRSSNKPKN